METKIVIPGIVTELLRITVKFCINDIAINFADNTIPGNPDSCLAGMAACRGTHESCTTAHRNMIRIEMLLSGSFRKIFTALAAECSHFQDNDGTFLNYYADSHILISAETLS